MIDFEWDTAKSEANLMKHNVAFNEAASVFKDDLSIYIANFS